MIEELEKRFAHVSSCDHGRSMKDGYVRGWGLHFSTLHTQIAGSLQDKRYKKALSLTGISSVKLANLYLIIRYYLPRIEVGNIVEFGCYRGGSLFFMALVAEELGIKVIGVDSFEGFPTPDFARDCHGKGQFKFSLDQVETMRDKLGLDNVELIKGEFGDIDVYKKLDQPIALAHIDCDLYQSVADAYLVAKSKMVKGGYIVFDDPLTGSCLGAMEAVETFLIQGEKLHAEQAYPHLVFRYKPLEE